jgi:long-chain acyl-CoA synthetase
MEATQTVALRVAADDRSLERRDGAAASERTLPALFLVAGRDRGSQVAMRWKRRGIWEAMTWADYAAAVREVGCALAAFGIQRGDRIAILSDNRPEWLFADFGAQSVGCVTVGIAVSESGDRSVDILNASGARVLFVDNAEQLDAVAGILARTPALKCIVHFDERVGKVESDVQVASLSQFRDGGRQFDGKNFGRWETDIARMRADDVATWVYEPNSDAVALTHRDLARQIDAIAAACPAQDRDEQLSILSLSLVQERCFSAYRATAVGSIVNFAEGPDNLVDGLREIAPHIVMATPSILEALETTVAGAMSDASPLGRLAWRLAVDPANTRPKARSLGSLIARALVLNRARTMVGLARTRTLLCSGAAVPPALSSWYRELGLNVEVLGEDWRASGANDTLVHKESR